MRTHSKRLMIAPLLISLLLAIASLSCSVIGPSAEQIANQTSIAGIQASLDALNVQKTATQDAGTAIAVQKTQDAHDTATAKAEASATAEAKTTATAQSAIGAADVPSSWQLMAYDSFDKNTYGWPEEKNYKTDWATTTYDITDGVFEWDVTSHQGVNEWLYPQRIGSVGDFFVSVNISTDREESQSGYGIVFRANPTTFAHYGFVVDESGSFSIYIINENQVSNVIRSGNTNQLLKGGNTLAVKGLGGQFRFYVNGEQIIEVSDDRLKSGRLGVAIELYRRNIEVKFRFDDFTVLKP